ncbi:OLC1v1013956C1 [Oldenlandia corymbosa var. corymbosa]|uniref:OLC1v1013956C1 n=1 Tax=Oldenlandia corymbosa var. corymbosa TaxID=529605 RepID=A0AAV1E1Q9_OLDCO|nr:OLC1v1013956C1 [Oldenlandia corymbosa var. corymbosa]
MAAPATTTDGEQKVLATAQQIVKSLHSSTNVSADDVILLFSSIDTRFANLSNLMQTSSSSNQTSSPNAAAATAAAGFSPSNSSSPSVVAGLGDDDSFNSPSNLKGLSQLEEAENLLHRWESNGEDSGGIDDYLQVVDHILQLTEDLSFEQQGEEGGDGDVVVDRAENALQMAMARLEDEFRHVLIRNVVPFNIERIGGSLIRRSSLSSASSADGLIHQIPDFDSASFADPVEEISGRYHRHVAGASLGGEDVFIDLVSPDAINDLKGIASRMIRAGYEKECCQVYSSVRRDVLDECMNILEVEKHSIEDVHGMNWESLNQKMKNWIRALKIVVRVLLPSEKLLCEDIFSGADVIEDVCFIEATKGCVMQLLNFGEAVAIGIRSAEKLFRFLDMYDALSDVFPDLQELFNDKEAGDMVCTEAQGVLDNLAEAAIGTCLEFENAVKGETSRRPIQNGDIHPLTRYVMNYVYFLVDYSSIFNRLLENTRVALESEDAKGKDTDNLESEDISPIAQRILSIIKTLETNLEEKARLYEDGGLQYVFLMNNILYIVQKVKASELKNLLGDNWIRRRRGQVRQYATSYLRASWTKVLSFLKDEGIGGSGSNASKVVLKERFKNFNACFEEIYRIQTAWKVPDLQLRDELKISISEKLIPAYRSFLGRFGSHLESGKHAGKYIKYSAEDLEAYLSEPDLFEGVPKVLHHMRRKSSSLQKATPRPKPVSSYTEPADEWNILAALTRFGIWDRWLSKFLEESVHTGDETYSDAGSISKGKEHAFNFDKMDIDFNLPGVLRKIPSFNSDIPDIDIFSRVVKDGEERSKESTSGTTHETANGSDFTYNFNDLDVFNFKDTSKKEGIIGKGDETKEEYLNKLLAQESKDCLVEDGDGHQHESCNLQVCGTVISSDVDMQADTGSRPDLSTADSPHRPVKGHEGHLRSEAGTNERATYEALTEKRGSSKCQELECQLDKSMSPESLPQEVPVANESVVNKSVHSVLRNELCRDTVPEGLEQVGTKDPEAFTLERSAKTLIADSGSNSEIPAWSGSFVHTTTITEEKETGPQGQSDMEALVAIKEVHELAQSRRKDEKFLSDNCSAKLDPQKQDNVKNLDVMELSSTLNCNNVWLLLATLKRGYFNLHGVLRKIPSFNSEIPDIDIFSRVVKDGEERSKESSSGTTQEKANGFDLTFNLNDLDVFNFKAISKKECLIGKGGEAKEEDHLKQLFAQESRDCLVEDGVDMQGDTGSNPDLSTPDSPYRVVKGHGSHLESEAAINEGAIDEALTDKRGSGKCQELECQLDKSDNGSPELVLQKQENVKNPDLLELSSTLNRNQVEVGSVCETDGFDLACKLEEFNSAHMPKTESGSTTLAFIFSTGIMVAADTLVSGKKGPSKSKRVDKIGHLDTYMLATIVGSEIHRRHTIDLLKEVEEAKKKHLVTPEWAAKRLSHYLSSTKSDTVKQLSARFMVLGYDTTTDQKIPQIYVIDQTGVIWQTNCFATGSGSVSALQVLFPEWRFNMDICDAVDLTMRGICSASIWDRSTGAHLSVSMVSSKGH